MYSVSGIIESAGINLPETEDFSPIALTTTIILTTVLSFVLLTQPITKDGAISLLIAGGLSALGSLLVAKLVIMRLIETTRDAQKATQVALSKSEEQAAVLSSVLDRLNLQKLVLDQHAFVSEVDAQGKFTYVNDVFCNVSGFTREELIGKRHNIISTNEDSSKLWNEMHQTVLDDKVWQGEVRSKRKDGQDFWLIQTIAGVKNDAGELTGYIDFGTEITELKQLQAEMFRKGQMAKLGELTSTVAHEIRNPLGAVKTGAYLLEKKIEKSGTGLEFPKEFGRINKGIQRCDSIITELLDFSRSKLVNPSDVELDTWAAAILDEESETLSKSIALNTKFALEGITVAIDTAQMRRVLVNLVSNAAEAMVGKGDQLIENPTTNPRIEFESRLNGDTVEFSVSDNGPGMPEDVLEKIREPLFTTKSFGVGLGIPAVEKILENHGGGLKIDTQVDKGTTMVAWIPLITSREQQSVS